MIPPLKLLQGEEAEYRADFRPHAIVLTEREIPEQSDCRANRLT
jgi:hypothetical protein